jgi:hypothetical protein
MIWCDALNFIATLLKPAPCCREQPSKTDLNLITHAISIIAYAIDKTGSTDLCLRQTAGSGFRPGSLYRTAKRHHGHMGSEVSGLPGISNTQHSDPYR